jgi:hypothetical protein
LAQGELWLNNNHESPGLFARADDDSLIEFTPEKLFLQDGTDAKPRTVNAKLKDAVSVKDFGAKGDGSVDDTAAIQAAINAHDHVVIPAGRYRCDGGILINSTYTRRKLVSMSAGTTLVRVAASSTSTDPVVELLGDYGHFDGGFGEILSENDSPRGVVALGHRDTGTLQTGNGLCWSFVNCDVRCKTYTVEPIEAATVGVYIPSAQPAKGSSSANYFGTVSNVRVFDASVAYWLTDISNSHTFVNCAIDHFWHYGWRLNGAYANSIYGGFINGCMKNGGYAIYLGNKLNPAAAHAATHQSSNNNIFGITMELYSSGNHGVHIPAGVGGFDSAHNFVQFNWNSSGTPVEDLTDGTANTIHDCHTTFRLGENLKMPDTVLSGKSLLQIGTTSQPSSHAIARTCAPGLATLVIENLGTTVGPPAVLEIQWNQAVTGYNGAVINAYHVPTAKSVFKVLDDGNCQNVNNVYGAISDRKLKNLLGAASSQWDDVKFLADHLQRYTLKSDPLNVPQIGWVAQEIEGQCPGLVFDTPDMKRTEGVDADGNKTVANEPTGTTTKGVRYSVAMLKGFKALGEAMARIEQLEHQIAALSVGK